MKPFTIPMTILLLLLSISFFGNERGKKDNFYHISQDEQLPPFSDGEGVYWNISGYVYLGSGTSAPFAGVTVNFSNVGNVTTNASGYFSYDVPHNWSGTVTPSYCGTSFEFQPAQRAYATVKKHFTQQNFNGFQLETFSITGSFTHNQTGEPLANTLVNFANGMSVTTDANGGYSITVVPCWSDTLRPLSAQWNFSPAYRFFAGVTSNLTDQDFGYLQKSFGLPPGWEYVNTGTVHIISVFTSSNPNLCGIPLQQGDYIGVFYKGTDGLMYCAGAGEWTGTSNTPVMVNGDDSYTAQKDGFSYGEVMNWRIFRWTTDQKEYVVYPTYQTGGYLVGDNKWYSGGLSIVNGLNAYHSQLINVPAGWSGISGYVTPVAKPAYVSGTQVQFLMSPILSNLIILQGLTSMYYPSQNINTLASWNVNSGYKIKVNQNVTLSLPGCPLTNRSQTLPVNWSIMPVKSECNVSAQQLFASILNRVTVVKDVAGPNVFWPAMGIYTLQVLEPGKAYMVSLTQSSTVTFPACTNQKQGFEGNNAILINKTTWPDPVQSPASHTIAIHVDALKNFSEGDFIGAFTLDGICAGLAEISTLNENVGITLFGNDPTASSKTGFEEGELISFRLYKSSTGETLGLLAEFDPTMISADGNFMDNGLSLITALYATTTGIGGMNQQANPRIFPNPATGIINVVGIDRQYRMTIVDVLGSLVFDQTYSGSSQVDLSGLRKSLYIVKLEGDDFLTTEKLLLR